MLSRSKQRVDAVRAASKRKGFSFTLVHDEEQVSYQDFDEGILVIDAEAARNVDRLLGARRAKWPILVVVPRFDSAQWVELFKAGATEVIGGRLDARKVDGALDGLMVGWMR